MNYYFLFLTSEEKSFSSKECRGFFEGILPEQNNRDLISRISGISDNDDFSILQKIGGECAGSVTFVEPNEQYPTTNNEYLSLRS